MAASGDDSAVDWDWLESHTPAEETKWVRHISLEGRTLIKLDGRKGEAVALKP